MLYDLVAEHALDLMTAMWIHTALTASLVALLLLAWRMSHNRLVKKLKGDMYELRAWINDELRLERRISKEENGHLKALFDAVELDVNLINKDMKDGARVATGEAREETASLDVGALMSTRLVLQLDRGSLSASLATILSTLYSSYLEQAELGAYIQRFRKITPLFDLEKGALLVDWDGAEMPINEALELVVERFANARKSRFNLADEIQEARNDLASGDTEAQMMKILRGHSGGNWVAPPALRAELDAITALMDRANALVKKADEALGDDTKATLSRVLTVAEEVKALKDKVDDGQWTGGGRWV